MTPKGKHQRLTSDIHKGTHRCMWTRIHVCSCTCRCTRTHKGEEAFGSGHGSGGRWETALCAETSFSLLSWTLGSMEEQTAMLGLLLELFLPPATSSPSLGLSGNNTGKEWGAIAEEGYHFSASVGKITISSGFFSRVPSECLRCSHVSLILGVFF